MRCFLNSPTRTKMTFRPSSSLPGSGTEILKSKDSFDFEVSHNTRIFALLRLSYPRSRIFCRCGSLGSRSLNQSGAPFPSTLLIVQKLSSVVCARSWLNLAWRRKRRRKASSECNQNTKYFLIHPAPSPIPPLTHPSWSWGAAAVRSTSGMSRSATSVAADPRSTLASLSPNSFPTKCTCTLSHHQAFCVFLMVYSSTRYYNTLALSCIKSCRSCQLFVHCTRADSRLLNM